MKLFFSPASPYVRKVTACAIALGLESRIERLPSAANPVNRDASIVAQNPLGKVPTLLTDDGQALYDSRVICEYLDALAGGGQLFPAAGPARWQALHDQALGDGLLDAALLVRYETAMRPAELRWQAWTDGQYAKITSSLDVIEAQAASYGDRFDIGSITIAAALGYLDFRFTGFDWRQGRPRAAAWFAAVSARPALSQTVPADPPPAG